jgi:beta-phosphoglucomutase-like phosphatase (HAD superfamily)
LRGVGASAPAIGQHLIELYDITTHTTAELVKMKRAESVASVTRPVAQGGPDLASLWYAGVSEAVQKLHSSGVQLALCTSNLRVITSAVLKAGSLDDAFAKRIVQEDIGNERMKPDPTPYIRAVSQSSKAHVLRCCAPHTDCVLAQLELVGDDGGHTVAFEDSANGVRSAVGAGIRHVLGVCNNCESHAEATIAAEQLFTAGAVGTFRTTVDAIGWVLAEMQQSPRGRSKL